MLKCVSASVVLLLYSYVCERVCVCVHRRDKSLSLSLSSPNSLGIT